MKKLLILLLMFCLITIPASGLWAVNESRPYSGRQVGTWLPRTAVTIAASGTTFNTTFTTNGMRATRYILECPNMTGNGTTTLSIINANSVTIYTGAAHAESTNYSVPIDVELVGTYTLRLTLSIAAGDATTAYLTIFGEP